MYFTVVLKWVFNEICPGFVTAANNAGEEDVLFHLFVGL